MTASRPDIRAYLEVRTTFPRNWSPDGSRLLVASNATGTSQLFRIDVPDLADLGGLDGSEAYRSGDDPSASFEAIGPITQLTDEDEPVGGAYLPTAGPVEPDGDRVERLLVTRDTGGNERHQLYLMDAAGGPLHPLVHDPDHIHRPGGVTRDGARLAFSTNARNGVDFDVHVLDLDTRGHEPVWSPGGWAGASGFSPDGSILAVHALTEQPGDNTVHLLDLADGLAGAADAAVELAAHDEPSSVGGPVWLPDSSAFFFSCDVGRDRSAIARWDRATGEWEYVLDPGWDCGVALDWTGRWLLLAWNEEGYTRTRLYDPGTLEPLDHPTLTVGDGVFGPFSFSHDGRRLAFGATTAQLPGDVQVVDLTDDDLHPAPVTSSPEGVDTAALVPWQVDHVTSFDGETVPLFVATPDGGPADGDGAHPVVVMIHGGPESQFRPSYSAMMQYLVASGFAVVAPNVRGSTGYGKRYEHLDDVELRLDSVRDLAAVHGWIDARRDLAADRAALWGGSYGGYMVLAGLAFQPDLWAAGVDIVGISSLVTFLENTSPWRRRFREREYGSLSDDRDFLVEASPLTHIDEIRAPLLIIHGANDPRVPLSEAEQLHDVLIERGVRCDLLVYSDEGHGLAKLTNRLDAYPKAADFLHDVLG